MHELFSGGMLDVPVPDAMECSAVRRIVLK
jgi:hypothetical protein